ncbi:hypothetical protein [Olleya sp. Bg11-27]|uniref:hypothetical protein n=1 Tax=Olleya sp. Bg11-27 TaxID=2058135 RepID=UPI000C319FF2|nr:hypothetical protein [Olleya sp. Bg11-27]AUC77130.1 hypothetical protein CW732_16175 [Olleya sp. Bg11-27]
MSIKIKQSLTESLIKIERKEFDEETIRTLLIVSREYLKYDGLVKELAHFIAHPKRDRGIFHKKVNSRYAKFKLIEEQLLKKQPEIKTEEELNDYMLRGVDFEKIDSKLFSILYFDGLDDLPESHLIKYAGYTKAQAKKTLKDNYTKKDNFYYLNTLRTKKMISLLEELPNTNEDKEIQKFISEGQELIGKVNSSINSLLKEIRGTIHFYSVFDVNSLSSDFENNFKKILNEFNIDSKYTNIITDNIQDILICLMTLIHDSILEFYDKNTARVYLCAHLENNEIKEIESISQKKSLYENGVLALYTNYKFENKSNSFPLFVSELKLKNYINENDFMNENIDHSTNEIPWISAKRKNEKMKK